MEHVWIVRCLVLDQTNTRWLPQWLQTGVVSYACTFIWPLVACDTVWLFYTCFHCDCTVCEGQRSWRWECNVSKRYVRDCATNGIPDHWESYMQPGCCESHILLGVYRSKWVTPFLSSMACTYHSWSRSWANTTCRILIAPWHIQKTTVPKRARNYILWRWSWRFWCTRLQGDWH